jgi:hypothetical protein
MIAPRIVEMAARKTGIVPKPWPASRGGGGGAVTEFAGGYNSGGSIVLAL